MEVGAVGGQCSLRRALLLVRISFGTGILCCGAAAAPCVRGRQGRAQNGITAQMACLVVSSAGVKTSVLLPVWLMYSLWRTEAHELIRTAIPLSSASTQV